MPGLDLPSFTECALVCVYMCMAHVHECVGINGDSRRGEEKVSSFIPLQFFWGRVSPWTYNLHFIGEAMSQQIPVIPLVSVCLNAEYPACPVEAGIWILTPMLVHQIFFNAKSSPAPALDLFSLRCCIFQQVISMEAGIFLGGLL